MAMTKKLAEQYFNVTLRNKVMRENKLKVRFYVEKGLHGDYELKKKSDISNFPEKINEYRWARDTWNNFIKENNALRAAWD